MIQLKRRPTDWMTRRFGLALLAWTSPLVLGFAIFDDAQRGFVAWVLASSIALAAFHLWELRKFAWFWAALFILVTAHGWLLMSIDWPRLGHGRAALPLALLDYGLVRGVFWSVQRLAGRAVPGN